jgi:hypothetical protein
MGDRHEIPFCRKRKKKVSELTKRNWAKQMLTNRGDCDEEIKKMAFKLLIVCKNWRLRGRALPCDSTYLRLSVPGACESYVCLHAFNLRGA